MLGYSSGPQSHCQAQTLSPGGQWVQEMQGELGAARLNPDSDSSLGGEVSDPSALGIDSIWHLQQQCWCQGTDPRVTQRLVT